MSKSWRGDVAVFTRNWPTYLRDAVKIGRDRPDQKITFKAGRPWVGAANAVRRHRPIAIYIAPIEGTGIEYVAELHDVYVIEPDSGKDTPKAKQMLEYSLPATRYESLDDVVTLYAISNCRKVREIPLTRLVKISDDKPLSADFNYSYSLVHPDETIS